MSRKKRPSRTTMPIDSEELERLVKATAEHRAAGGLDLRPEDFLSADGDDQDQEDDDWAPLEEHSEPRGIDPVSAEEFTGRGSSISEAVTSVTDTFPALTARRATRGDAPTVGGAAARAGAKSVDDSAELDSAPDLWRPSPGGEKSSAEEERVLRLAEQLEQQGELEAALERCERLLEDSPHHEAAEQLRERVQAALICDIELHLGDLDRIPVVCVPPNEITWHKLDHQAGFLLSRIDGMLSYNDVAMVSGMNRYEALRTLLRLAELKLIMPQR